MSDKQRTLRSPSASDNPARMPEGAPKLSDQYVLPAESERVRELLAQGWSARWRSFGASLPAGEVSADQFDRFFEGVPETLRFRPLTVDDVDCVLDLDGRTAGDYPGGPATTPVPLAPESAVTTDSRFGFGAFEDRDGLVAMTFMDVLSGGAVETDFTVVAPQWRGRGIGTALKAYSIQKMVDEGVREFRTGGAAENLAIWATNKALGYKIDEE